MQPNLGILPMFGSDPDFTPLRSGLVQRRRAPQMDHSENLSRQGLDPEVPGHDRLVCWCNPFRAVGFLSRRRPNYRPGIRIFETRHNLRMPFV